MIDKPVVAVVRCNFTGGRSDRSLDVPVWMFDRAACSIRKQICKAVTTALEAVFNQEVAQDFEDTLVGGGLPDHPGDFDEDTVREAGQDLAARAASKDPQVQAEAYEEIEALGIRPVDLMQMVYQSERHRLDDLDDRIRDREQCRHVLMRDFERQ